LNDVKVQAAIQRAQAKRLSKLEISAERVLKEIGTVAFSDLRRMFNDAGQLKEPEDWPDEIAGAIGSVEVLREKTINGEVTSTDSVIKVKTWNKPQALEMLAKHLGLLKERVEHSGPNGGPIETLEHAAIVRQSLASKLSRLARP
jgi:phage terminase small subunit